MRRILVDHARRKAAEKRGGDRARVALPEHLPAARTDSDVLAVDEALDQLAAEEPRVAELVKLHFFPGLTIDDAAAALGITPQPLPPLDAGERMTGAQEVAKKGDHALAAKNTRKIALSAKNPGVLYNAAWVYGLYAGATSDPKLKEGYARNTVYHLDKAFANDLKGFFASTNEDEFAHIRQDPDLDPVRDRDDFMDLIARAARPREVAPPPRPAN